MDDDDILLLSAEISQNFDLLPSQKDTAIVIHRILISSHNRVVVRSSAATVLSGVS